MVEIFRIERNINFFEKYRKNVLNHIVGHKIGGLSGVEVSQIGVAMEVGGRAFQRDGLMVLFIKVPVCVN